MTALDDALAQASVVWSSPNLTADWLEQYPSEPTDGNPDATRELGQQLTGDFKVEHSLDDGFPDPVTMTTGNDASGVLTTTLNGRDQVIADSWGWRTVQTGNSTGTLITTQWPTDIKPGDYAIVAASFPSNSPVITPYPDPSEVNYQWTVLADVSDGTGLRTIVWGRPYWGTALNMVIKISVSTATSWLCTAMYARTASGIPVQITPGAVSATAEPSSVALHTAGPVSLVGRGFILGVWSSVSATAQWSTSTSTELGEKAATTDTMISTTGLLYEDTYSITASTSAATAVATLIAIPLRIKDRQRMDALKYFSPFNVDSPVYGRDRDTAPTQFDFNVLTASGVQGATLHKGQMATIGIKGRQAELTAVSKTRLDLAKSLVLPVVFGNRENCTVDWLATWIMARGGQFAGPAPTSYCAYWAPLYGSTHAHYDSNYGYNSAVYYTADQSGIPLGLRPPTVVKGPFLTAMYAQQTSTRVEEIRLYPLHLNDRDRTYTTSMDLMSQSNNSGRISFWLRGDAAVDAPAFASDNYLMHAEILARASSGGTVKGGVLIDYRPSDRKMRVSLGGQSTGFTYVAFTGLPALPTDGLWHFIGVAWDWDSGTAKVIIDGTEATSNLWATSALTVFTDLPTTDQANSDAGGIQDVFLLSRLPISDVQIETRPYSDTWSYMYPTPAYPSSNATIRTTGQSLEAIAQDGPVIGWDTLVELAQSTLSSYRTNELDNLEFLPLSYFGETAQMTSSEVVDTQVNASDLDVDLDPTKSRNAVTVKFPETRVDTMISPVFDLSSSIPIPPGSTTMTFALDIPAAEIHYQSTPFNDNWKFTNLTAGDVTAKTFPLDKHFMSVNYAPDGTGVYLVAATINARIISATATSVTIKFTNNALRTFYLVNNGTEVPFLRVYGYAVRASDGYVTQRDAGSIGTRRERPLDTQLDWVQNRNVATQVASHLVTATARPRAEVKLTVMGDPRRKPGQAVTIKDSEGTQASGLWRILSITHNGSGAEYTQELQLVSVYPVFTWDAAPGWDYMVWGV